ncbi:MAG TPA: hypothetical protein VGA16_00965 [Candidatus Limnocylindria bacterium]
MRDTYVRPAGTSWSAVVGGWIAAIGAAALVAPLIAAILTGRPAVPNDLALAVPVVLGLMIAYLIGGYVAGRMAGYNTSWHGLMTAFFGLFVTLLALLAAAAADQGLLASSGVRSLSDVFPGVRELDLRTLGDTVTFGAILSFLATIFAGWLGGLLAPDRYLVPVSATAVAAGSAREVAVEERHIQRRERPRFRLLPAMGRKGGETAARSDEEIRETRVERP